ncbi:MAG: DUF58 domain-containing protein [Candidatus Dadabacteria bacterium]|nr:MAG: DUF58 domain-containing protein [Candidatus Dadabacteria bacterium]
MLPETFTPTLLKQLELMKIRSKRRFLGTKQGGHVSLRKGHGIEFSDYRKYSPGDNPRHIDWGVYARSDRLYVKRFQEEENIAVLILIDGSNSMRAVANDKKWEKARDIAIALAYTALMDQDKVIICPIGGEFLPPFDAPSQIHTMADLIDSSTFKKNPDMVRITKQAAARIRFPGKAVVISDFLFELNRLEEMFAVLLAKNLDITAIQVLGNFDLNPHRLGSHATLEDGETEDVLGVSFSEENIELYRDALNIHIESIQNYFYRSDIRYVSTLGTDSLSSFVLEGLTAIGLVG